jgi:hypothetical protein
MNVPVYPNWFSQNNIELEQPLYGFGDRLIDEAGDAGVVVQMGCATGEWEYTLFYEEFGVIGKWLPQGKLSKQSVTVVVDAIRN